MKPLPEPGPAQKKLGCFVGTWISEANLKQSLLGPGGRVTTHEESQWIEGGFFLVIRSKFSSPGLGNGSSIAIMGYDLDRQVYTYDEFDSFGEAIHSTGTVSGDTWTWNGQRKVGDQMLKTRLTMRIVSPALYTFTFALSPDGTNWDPVMEGTSTQLPVPSTR